MAKVNAIYAQTVTRPPLPHHVKADRKAISAFEPSWIWDITPIPVLLQTPAYADGVYVHLWRSAGEGIGYLDPNI